MEPGFLIIGAQRCGTTTLAEVLKTHSSAFVCEPREPEYFSTVVEGRALRTWPEYLSLFEDAGPGVLCGEASTGTMTKAETIPLIEDKLPAVRLVAILRNPAERAYSGMVHTVRKGRLPVGDAAGVFEREANAYLEGRESEYDWFARSEYGRQLEPFVARFGDRLRVVILEELISNPEKELRQLQEFLGLEYEPLELVRENAARVPRSRFVELILATGRKFSKPFELWIGESRYRNFRSSLMALMGKRLAPLGRDLADELNTKGFGADIGLLEDLVGRSVEAWKVK